MAELHENERAKEAGAILTGTRHEGTRPWLSAPRVALGVFMLAALGGGALWRRRQRRKRIELQPMSEDWLREREYGAGQRPEDH